LRAEGYYDDDEDEMSSFEDEDDLK
jgi:hypothetical protein